MEWPTRHYTQRLKLFIEAMEAREECTTVMTNIFPHEIEKKAAEYLGWPAGTFDWMPMSLFQTLISSMQCKLLFGCDTDELICFEGFPMYPGEVLRHVYPAMYCKMISLSNVRIFN
ncbi:MAG: hypothetical protein K5787_19010 [Lentisphaeria bacterium]|nr:hypothetical protein [Lentisphaeria bacterium]